MLQSIPSQSCGILLLAKYFASARTIKTVRVAIMVDDSNSNYHNLVGRLLRSWREERSLTQRDIAKKLTECGHPLDETMPSKYEVGSRLPNGAYFAYLAHCFEVSEEIISEWIQAMSMQSTVQILNEYIEHAESLKRQRQ